MKRLVGVIALLSIAVASVPPVGMGQTRRDMFICVGAADSVDATLYVPTRFRPKHGFAALIFVHGFGLSKDWDTLNCRVYAKRGYVTLAYSVRGQGKSSGVSTIMSSRERLDLRKVLAFLRSMPEVNKGAVGIVGGSQGGLHGLWCAADSLPIKAISTDVIIPGWASDMLANGCVRRTFAVLLNTAGVRYDPVRDLYWNLLRHDEYDSLAALFPRDRDINPHALNASRIPMIRFLKWQDHYFNASGGADSYSGYAGVQRMYLGTVGHYSDESLSEQLYQDDLVTRWLACFLQGRRNGILRDRSVTVGYSSLPVEKGGNFTWNHLSVSEWPLVEARPLRLYFGPDSLLSFAVPTWRMDSLLLRNSMEQPTYTFDTAFVEGFRGPRFEAALPRRTIAFMSQPLALPLLWVGVPHMSIFVRSNAIKFPLHVQIYEVDPLGEKYFVNRINWTARHWDAGSSGIVEGRGIAHAHCFRGGSRIRVVVTNLDVTNGSLLGSYPFVLPLFSSADVTIYHGAEHPSYVELPIAAGCVPDEGQRASTR